MIANSPKASSLIDCISLWPTLTAAQLRTAPILATKINPLIDSIISSCTKKIKISELKTYDYMGEQFADIIYFFQLVTKIATIEQQYNDFVDFFNHLVIYSLRQNGQLLGINAKYYQNLSGMGIFLPRSKQEIDKYRYLSVFSDIKLVELFHTIGVMRTPKPI